jgi:predicted anti-sigma-YlaC factor YlaD
MNCQEIGQLMSLSLDDALTTDEARQLQMHLDRCQSCQAKWDSMARISCLFADAPLVPPPTGFVAKVSQRLAQREARRRGILGGVILFMGTICLMVLALPAIIGAFTALEQLFSYFPLLSHGMQLILKLISIGRPLVKAGWLVLTALLSPSGQPILVSYSLAVFVLTALWVRLVSGRQRGYQGVRLARG